MEALRRGLGGLTNFSGRDPRRIFWPYAGIVLLVTIIVMGAINTVFIGMVMTRPQANGMPDISGVILAMGLEILATVALLAAAVTRRLHDTGRPGYWGLAPLPFLAFGLGGFYALTRTLSNIEGGEVPPLFMAIFFNNVLYMAMLGLLIVLLVLPTKPEANRYGEPPAA